MAAAESLPAIFDHLAGDAHRQQTPFWKARPCPPWAADCTHQDQDHPNDRNCWRDHDPSVWLSLADPQRYEGKDGWSSDPPTATVYLGQNYHQLEAHVELEFQTGHHGSVTPLSLDEAAEIGAALLDAVATARGEQGDFDRDRMTRLDAKLGALVGTSGQGER